MSSPPSTLTIHSSTEPDRVASRLLLQAYALVVPFHRRSLTPDHAPVRQAADSASRREQRR
jgi:hypothetical protein